MEKLRNKFIGYFLLLLFIWYIGGISLFPHTHIIDGVSIVHSHPNPDKEHQNEEEFLTIQMLAQFQSCGAGEGVLLPEVFLLLMSESSAIGDISLCINDFHRYFGLRAPPAA